MQSYADYTARVQKAVQGVVTLGLCEWQRAAEAIRTLYVA